MSDSTAVTGNIQTATSAQVYTARGYAGLAAVAIATLIFCIPFIGNFADYTDEGVLIHGADRMLRGETLYVDFFEFLPPGGFVLTAAWFQMVGISMLSARAMVLITITAIACFTYLSCLRASQRPIASAVIALAWVAMSQGLWTQHNHHWFTTLFSMITCWATLAGIQQVARQKRYTILAGLAAGAAAMITPTRGALAMTAGAFAYLNLRRRFWQLCLYSACGFVVPVLLVAFLFYQDAFMAAYQSVIEYPATQYASIQGVSFGSGASPKNIALVLTYLLVPLLTLFVIFRNRQTWRQDRTLTVCMAFGVASFLGCFPRPDIVHIYFSVPLICPLLAYCLRFSTQRWQPPGTPITLGIVSVLALVFFGTFTQNARNTFSAAIVPTARGAVEVFGNPEAPTGLMRALQSTPREDGHFFYPFIPLMPFLADRHHVSRYDVLIPGYSTAEQYQQACESVQSGAQWIVLNRLWMHDPFLLHVFPAMENPTPPERVDFERFLLSEYSSVATFGNIEIRRSNSTLGTFRCAEIAP